MFELAEPPVDPAGVNPFWLFGSVTDRLEAVLEQVPTEVTWQALRFLGEEPLGAAERILFALAWDRQANAAAGAFHAAVADATTPTRTQSAMDLEAELGIVLRRSAQGVTGLGLFARRVVEIFPVMHTLWLRGEAGLAYARLLDDATLDLTDELAARVDAEVSGRAATLTLAGFRKAVRRVVAAVDPDNARKRHERAKKTTSGVKVYPRPDGMATVAITTTATNAIEMAGQINTRADKLRTDDDERSHGERQVQAVNDALTGAPVTGEGKVRNRRGAQILAVIDLESLLGLRNHPGEIRGYGPVPAQLVRDLLAQDGSVLRRLVTDPVTGTLADYAVTAYTPDPALRGILEARDISCRFPGCTRDATWCDTEHRDPYDDGGETSCANCGLMCRRHHNLKTHHGFTYTRPDPATGETVWTTPNGFRARQCPAYYTPDGPDIGDTELIGLARDGPPGDDPPF